MVCILVHRSAYQPSVLADPRRLPVLQDSGFVLVAHPNTEDETYFNGAGRFEHLRDTFILQGWPLPLEWPPQPSLQQQRLHAGATRVRRP
jgi:hypothetical protein